MADVATIQARLNALGAQPPLEVDGVLGPKTVEAIKTFQRSKNIEPDGIVGPITLAALRLNGASSLPSSDATSIVAVRGLEKKSNAFKAKLVKTSQALGIQPDWLATVISFETDGTFDPAKQNPYSKATGLIQFMSSTANGLQTTLEALRRMNDVEQLDYVYRYLSSFKGRMHNLDDVYLAVFMPSQMGRSSDSAVASEGSIVYTQNSGFDREGKGYFTVGDITSTIHAVYNAGVQRGRIPVGTAMGSGLAALGLATLAAYYWKKMRG